MKNYFIFWGIVCFAFLCVIIFYMDTWGLTPKSQIDSQTIDEAIAAAIADHEADPTAHLGTGESIDVHRKNDILDHKAGSVLADKWSMTEIEVTDDFRLLSPWSVTGNVTNSDWPGAGLYVEYGSTNISKLYSPLLVPEPYFTENVDMLFQIAAQWFGASNNHVNIDLGYGVEDGTSGAGFGFVVIDGTLKALVGCNGTDVFSTISDVDITVGHIYRAHFIANEGVVHFYVDGLEVATLTKPTGTWTEDGNLTIKVKLTQSNDGVLRINDLYIARSVVPTI